MVEGTVELVSLGSPPHGSSLITEFHYNAAASHQNQGGECRMSQHLLFCGSPGGDSFSRDYWQSKSQEGGYYWGCKGKGQHSGIPQHRTAEIQAWSVSPNPPHCRVTKKMILGLQSDIMIGCCQEIYLIYTSQLHKDKHLLIVPFCHHNNDENQLKAFSDLNLAVTDYAPHAQVTQLNTNA